VVVYELLTGCRPFAGDDDVAVLEAHLSGQAPPLRGLRRDVPPALEAVVMKAMRRRSEERYPTAVALLEALDQLDGLNSESVAPREDPPLIGTVALGEAVALVRLAAVVAVGFLGVVTLAMAATIVLR
jgi:eukaryotic-like serine/threonine-protein kinase